MEITTKDLNTELKLKGYVRRISQVKSFLREGYYDCVNSKCRQEEIIERYDFTITDAIKVKCPAPSCGKLCQLDTEKSEFIDVEYAVLQGEDSKVVQFLDIVLYGKNVGKVTSGDYVEVSGTLIQKKTKKPGIYNMFLDIDKIKQLDKRMDNIKFTKSDIAKFKEVASSVDRIEILLEPFAPHLYGLSKIKEVLLHALIASPPTQAGDEHIRGDIHVLLIGEPSTGKSELLRTMAKNLIFRGIYCEGKGSSAVGLTAAVIKTTDGQWTVEAGVMPFGDGSCVFIDEFNKLKKEDKSGLNQGMEQQEIVIAKAGIYAVMQTRCGIIAGANPKYGHFDEHKHMIEQFEIEPALMSRFDFIVAMVEEPDLVGLTACHILDVVQDKIKIDIDADFLKKYIAYCRKNVNPELNDVSRQLLEDYYMELVELGRMKKEEGVKIYPRQLWTLIRVSRASARLRLSQVVEEQDAKKAIELYEYCLSTIGITKDQSSIDVFMVGPEKKRLKIQDSIFRIAQELEKRDGLIDKKELIDICFEADINKKEVNKFIKMYGNPMNDFGYLLREAKVDKFVLDEI